MDLASGSHRMEIYATGSFPCTRAASHYHQEQEVTPNVNDASLPVKEIYSFYRDGGTNTNKVVLKRGNNEIGEKK